jgi:hypothetical protein
MHLGRQIARACAVGLSTAGFVASNARSESTTTQTVSVLEKRFDKIEKHPCFSVSHSIIDGTFLMNQHGTL